MVLGWGWYHFLCTPQGIHKVSSRSDVASQWRSNWPWWHFWNGPFPQSLFLEHCHGCPFPHFSPSTEIGNGIGQLATLQTDKSDLVLTEVFHILLVIVLFSLDYYLSPLFKSHFPGNLCTFAHAMSPSLAHFVFLKTQTTAHNLEYVLLNSYWGTLGKIQESQEQSLKIAPGKCFTN